MTDTTLQKFYQYDTFFYYFFLSNFFIGCETSKEKFTEICTYLKDTQQFTGVYGQSVYSQGRNNYLLKLKNDLLLVTFYSIVDEPLLRHHRHPM